MTWVETFWNVDHVLSLSYIKKVIITSDLVVEAVLGLATLSLDWEKL